MTTLDINDIISIDRDLTPEEQIATAQIRAAEAEKKLWEARERIDYALSFARRSIKLRDGPHKQWLIDRMVRALCDDEYDDWRSDFALMGHRWNEGESGAKLLSDAMSRER